MPVARGSRAEVLAAPDPGAEIDFVVTRALPGRSLWAKPRLDGADRAAVLRTAGEQLRAVHEIRVRGAGPIVPGPRGIFEEWCPFVRAARDEAIPALVAASLLSARDGHALVERFGELGPALNRSCEGRLLHGDIECGHIYERSGAFTGFIDFGQIQAGDPVLRELMEMSRWRELP